MTRQLRTGFTVNGNACPDRDRLLSLVARARPTTMLVLDGKPLSLELYEAAQGETKVGHRQYDPAEGSEWKTKNAAQYVSEVTALLDPRIYVQVLNEPAINDVDLPWLLYWLMGVMDELYKRGYHGVIGNFPMGQIQQAHIENGLFDDFLRHAHQYRDYHYVGIHEYTAIIRYFGVGQWPYWANSPTDYFLNPANHSRDKWPTKEDLPCERINGALPPYWHIRRADWLTIRARELGITDDPQYWVTESGYDNMQDVSEVFPALVNRWGIAPGYDNLRGFNSLGNVWGAYWPEWTFDEAGFEQECWLDDDCYPANYVGWNNFMWTSDQWRRDGFDMSQNLQFHQLLVERAIALRTEPEPPGPDPEPQPDPPPDTEPVPLWIGWLGGVLLFILLFVVILGGILFVAHMKSVQALSAGGNIMDQSLVDIWTGLSAIPIFAAIGFGVPTIYYLIEIWKRYLDPRIPTPANKWLAFFLKPTPVGLFVFLVFVMAGSYYLAGTYNQDDAFKTVVEWVNTFFDAFGKLLLPVVVVQSVGSRWYNSNRAAGAAGFNAPSVTRN